ncbi:universal stress protein [Haloarcula nitratireducens]|uniref:Universal stress protein n=1 Tax=Haloarcula nitratireducens TaxID=2487749 RepID=A0AAW4PFN1_9EURY|nr:universal stress protein [Halomicroarcula nitratireducens]MBX0296120.1 universal stress protein [Halomicroarcula nitratireducens]
MSPYDRLLVPTDGSTVAEAAGNTAIRFARQFDAALHVIHVLESDEVPAASDDDAAREFDGRSEEVTSTIAEMAIDAGVDVQTASLDERESVHDTILEYADEHEIDCIVMGTHGRTGLDRFILGSVAELTLREATIPVLTVHEDTVVESAFDSFLVPTDGSSCATTAADHAIDLARWTDGTLHVINVVDISAVWGGANVATILDALDEAGEQTLNDVRARAKAADVTAIEGAVLDGIPYRAIVEYVEENDVDCIVMGTHGRTGLDRYLLGSVTERVIRLTDVPVLTVRERATDTEGGPQDGY